MKQKPIPTSVQLPPSSVIDTGDEEVWWWDSWNDAWMIGMPILMDLDEPKTLERWTHWLPADALPIP